MKQKTKSAAAKRFKVSGTGKIKHRSPGQSHFNARDTGNDTRHKRGDASLSPSDRQRVQELLPYIDL